MAALPQGIWLQPPQMGCIPRSTFQPYPTAFPDSQPPGVTPVGTALAISVSSAASGHMLAGTLKTQTELPPPGIGMPMVSH